MANENQAQPVQMAVPSERDQIITFLLNSIDGRNNIIKEMQGVIVTTGKKIEELNAEISNLKATIAAQTQAPTPAPPANPVTEPTPVDAVPVPTAA